MRRTLLWLLSCLLLWGEVALAQAPRPKTPPPEILELIEEGSLLVADSHGEILLEHQSDVPRVPASIVKILTAQIALDKLGPDFRFPTNFYLDLDNNLYVQGMGDPFLVSDEIRLIAQTLKAKGLVGINQLYLDASSFQVTEEIPGSSGSLNPYDALNGALVVNFNSLLVGRSKTGTVYSGEKETPLTPLGKARGMALKPGKSDRLNLTSDREESLRYVGELFLAIFEEQGILPKSGTGLIKSVPKGLSPFYVHRNSRPLTEVLQGLLRYSNNFIANQIYLYLGMMELGTPAELWKGKEVFEGYLKKHYPEFKITLHEASGLSRDNRFNAKAMIAILLDFQGHWQLLHPKRKVPLKSGTLTGVYNYAGYLPSKNGRLPFVILLDQKKNNRDFILLQLIRWSQSR